ncbi:MAG: hypothetical protein SFU91_13775 [Chloroherpetonaceae bacterium]|nr:hypothetical protein [Chloroherpetonaceae bacterium]
MAWRDFDELSPDEQRLVRSKARAFIFFASILMMIFGFSNVYEGIAWLIKDDEFISTNIAYPSNLTPTIVLSLMLGGFEMFCALGTIRLSYTAWRTSFFATPLLLVQALISTFVFRGWFLGFGSYTALALTALIFILLYLGRTAVLYKEETN